MTQRVISGSVPLWQDLAQIFSIGDVPMLGKMMLHGLVAAAVVATAATVYAAADTPASPGATALPAAATQQTRPTATTANGYLPAGQDTAPRAGSGYRDDDDDDDRGEHHRSHHRDHERGERDR